MLYIHILFLNLHNYNMGTEFSDATQQKHNKSEMNHNENKHAKPENILKRN